MAALIFSHSKACINKAMKEARKGAEVMEKNGNDYKEWYERLYSQALERELHQFDTYLEFASQLHQRYQAKITGSPSEHHYMITIRPKLECDCTIDDLKTMTERLVNRKCFLSYTYSFEQKGTCPEDLGKGFHVHIVARMKQRSKGEVVRDCVNTFNSWVEKGWMEPQGIDVKVTKNPTDLVQHYLIDYKSDDDHKEPTKSWDTIWRGHHSLDSLYRSSPE